MLLILFINGRCGRSWMLWIWCWYWALSLGSVPGSLALVATAAKQKAHFALDNPSRLSSEKHCPPGWSQANLCLPLPDVELHQSSIGLPEPSAQHHVVNARLFCPKVTGFQGHLAMARCAPLWDTNRTRYNFPPVMVIKGGGVPRLDHLATNRVASICRMRDMMLWECSNDKFQWAATVDNGRSLTYAPLPSRKLADLECLLLRRAKQAAVNLFDSDCWKDLVSNVYLC